MNATREMTPEERAHVSLRCRIGLHRWSVWLPIALSRPPMKKRLCFGCPKVQWAARSSVSREPTLRDLLIRCRSHIESIEKAYLGDARSTVAGAALLAEVDAALDDPASPAITPEVDDER